MVWGVDLVEQQLRVAAGEELALSQDELSPHGHAVEARLYSEDPAAGFLPAVGTVRALNLPSGAGIRVDLGIARGAAIGTDYDPMLAKLIAHGPDRPAAIALLDRALADLELLGVAHNAAFSRELLARPDVLEGRLDTGLLERALEEEALDLEPPPDLTVAAAFAIWLDDTAGETLAPGHWRRRFDDAGEVRIGPGWIELDGERREARARRRADGRIAVELDGIERGYAVARDGSGVWVGREGRVLHLVPRQDLIAEHIQEGSLEAPMPGKVLSVAVANGERVGAGDVLMILESMKMELQITAPEAGIVEGLDLGAGDQVGPGQILVAVLPEGDQAEEEER
jgi:acetyl-CoA/propionyl-CoA carboxylase biotin carboxyl carrier protein